VLPLKHTCRKALINMQIERPAQSASQPPFQAPSSHQRHLLGVLTVKTACYPTTLLIYMPKWRNNITTVSTTNRMCLLSFHMSWPIVYSRDHVQSWNTEKMHHFANACSTLDQHFSHTELRTIACKSSRTLFCARVGVRLAAQAVAH